nr:uncharacterized protein LOC123479896 isoform X2 [Desmodus rotundus]
MSLSLHAHPYVPVPVSPCPHAPVPVPLCPPPHLSVPPSTSAPVYPCPCSSVPGPAPKAACPVLSSGSPLRAPKASAGGPGPDRGTHSPSPAAPSSAPDPEPPPQTQCVSPPGLQAFSPSAALGGRVQTLRQSGHTWWPCMCGCSAECSGAAVGPCAFLCWEASRCGIRAAAAVGLLRFSEPSRVILELLIPFTPYWCELLLKAEKRCRGQRPPRFCCSDPCLRLPVPDDRPRWALLLVRLVHRLLPPLGVLLPPVLRVSIGGSDLQLGGGPLDLPLRLLDKDSLLKRNQLLQGAVPVPPGTLPRQTNPLGTVHGGFIFIPTVMCIFGGAPSLQPPGPDPPRWTVTALGHSKRMRGLSRPQMDSQRPPLQAGPGPPASSSALGSRCQAPDHVGGLRRGLGAGLFLDLTASPPLWV